MSRTRPYTVVLAMLTLLVGMLVGLTPPATAAPAAPGDPGDPPNLTVRLDVLTPSVTWGDDATLSVSTNRDEWLGGISIWRINADQSRTLVASVTDVGPTQVSTTGFQLGEQGLIATAEDLQLVESAMRTLTVTARPTTTTFLETSANPLAPVRVKVDSGRPDLVPSGSVRFTGDSFNVVKPLNAQGIAVLDGLPPGSHQVRALYACEQTYRCSQADATLEIAKFRATIAAETWPGSGRAGDRMWTRIWVEGPPPEYAGGDWTLVAEAPDGAEVPIAEGMTDGLTYFDVDLTAWAAEHVGEWVLRLDFEGNAWTEPKSERLGTLTVTDRRARTETVLTAPADGVPVGGTVTATVTSASGQPAGPVTLHTEGGTVLATAATERGRADLRLPASLAPGVHQVWAEYAGTEDHHGSVSQRVSLRVLAPSGGMDPGAGGTPGTPTPGTPTSPATGSPAGATSRAKAVVKGRAVAKRGRAVLRVVVKSGAPVAGRVRIRDGKRVVRTVVLRAGRAKVTLPLTRGKHRLTATYLGSPTVATAKRSWTVRVR